MHVPHSRRNDRSLRRAPESRSSLKDNAHRSARESAGASSSSRNGLLTVGQRLASKHLARRLVRRVAGHQETRGVLIASNRTSASDSSPKIPSNRRSRIAESLREAATAATPSTKVATVAPLTARTGTHAADGESLLEKEKTHRTRDAVAPAAMIPCRHPWDRSVPKSRNHGRCGTNKRTASGSTTTLNGVIPMRSPSACHCKLGMVST